MSRTRISATVDGALLAEARERAGTRDSPLLDAALAALVRELRGAQEREALRAMPYEGDPALAWEAPDGPELPYDGEVPADVLALARRRRA